VASPIWVLLVCNLKQSSAIKMRRSAASANQDYPPDLSILIGGGKETNKDSPSNGERSGNSPGRNLRRCGLWARGAANPSPLEKGALEGESPVDGINAGRVPGVALLGSAARMVVCSIEG